MVDNWITGGRVCGNYYNDVSNGGFIRICWSWGAGFIIAILTLVFHIPIHVALATSLTAMAFTTLSGVISHYREGNVVLTIGGIVGGCGAFGSYIGSKIGSFIPPYLLHWFTAGMLFLSAIFMCIKLIKFQNEEEVCLVKSKIFRKKT